MFYIWLARFGSFFAEHLSESVIAVLVWTLTDSNLLAAFTIASGRIALWTFGLKAGQIADRVRKEHILKITMVVTSLAFWLIAVSLSIDMLTATGLALMNFIAMGAKTFEYTAINTLITTIRETPDFKRNNVFIDSSKRWARILSPVVLLLLIDRINPGGLLFLIALTYSSVFYCYVKADYPDENVVPVLDKARNKKTPVLSLSVIRTVLSKDIAGVYALFALYNISYFSAIGIALPHYFSVSDRAADFGWALLAFSLGGLLGNRFYRYCLEENQPFTNLVLSMAMVGVACLYFSRLDALVLICLAAGFAGMGLPIMDMAMIEIIRARVSRPYHGMAFSLFRFVADFGLIAGALIGGLLISLSSIITYFSAGIWIFILLLVALMVKRIYRETVL